MANSSVVTGVNIGGSVAFVQSASANLSRTTITTTALGDSWETNVYGVARVSGSIEVLFDKSDHSAMTNQCSTAGTSVSATFTWNTAETWTGSLLITEASPNVNVDDLVKASFSFVGTGTWTV
jgi:hypothetical protein